MGIKTDRELYSTFNSEREGERGRLRKTRIVKRGRKTNNDRVNMRRERKEAGS